MASDSHYIQSRMMDFKERRLEAAEIWCYRRMYGAPFSHLFTELKISPIEVHIIICNSIGDISNSIEDISNLEISTNRPI